MDTSVLILAIFSTLLTHVFGNDQDIEALELHGPHPSFLPTPTFYTVEVGKMAILECAVANLEDRRVIWRKASEPNPLTVGRESFYNNDRVVIEHQPREMKWNLIIRKVRLTDAGVYECQVSSKLRHLRHHVLLTVKEKETETSPMPRPDIKITGSSFVEKDDQIYLICNATGLEHPPDDLDWFLNGNKLSTQENSKVFIRKFVSITARTIVSFLEIKDAQLNDSGVYVCRTSNLQIESMRVTVLNADSFNVKRGTIAGNSDKSSKRKTGKGTSQWDGEKSGHASQHRNSAHAQLIVLQSHLFIIVAMVIGLTRYWTFPS